MLTGIPEHITHARNRLYASVFLISLVLYNYVFTLGYTPIRIITTVCCSACGYGFLRGGSAMREIIARTVINSLILPASAITTQEMRLADGSRVRASQVRYWRHSPPLTSPNPFIADFENVRSVVIEWFRGVNGGLIEGFLLCR